MTCRWTCRSAFCSNMTFPCTTPRGERVRHRLPILVPGCEAPLRMVSAQQRKVAVPLALGERRRPLDRDVLGANAEAPAETEERADLATRRAELANDAEE